MIKALISRLAQGHRTIAYPDAAPVLPDKFKGFPILKDGECPADCNACISVCPTEALRKTAKNQIQLDMGRCLFCPDCAEQCPKGIISFSRDYQLAARKREDLLVSGSIRKKTALLDEKSKRLFGRSLKLRQVSAGGCNACEADINVLSTVVFDLGRFGIQIVASPRHADGLLITGPVSNNMKLALEKTYQAVSSPKIVIAVGTCAIAGGPYINQPEVHNGAEGIVPVDLYIPGCPPHPVTILDGLLQLLGKIETAK